MEGPVVELSVGMRAAKGLGRVAASDPSPSAHEASEGQKAAKGLGRGASSDPSPYSHQVRVSSPRSGTPGSRVVTGCFASPGPRSNVPGAPVVPGVGWAAPAPWASGAGSPAPDDHLGHREGRRGLGASNDIGFPVRSARSSRDLRDEVRGAGAVSAFGAGSPAPVEHLGQ